MVGWGGRQYLVDTPETKEGHEPSDNLTNALKVKDMVKHEDDDINDNYNHIGSVDSSVVAYSALLSLLC